MLPSESARHEDSPAPSLAYRTPMGEAWHGDSRALIDRLGDGSVSLVMTSPPFALLRKKEYGNADQAAYVDWLAGFAEKVLPKLKDDGSFVVDLGGAYERGVPVRSLYNFRVPIRFCDGLGYRLAGDFYWHNPSKLPSPAEWVTRRKVRTKDSVNTVWWFSKTEWPKADVTKVLVPYSDSMKKLLADPKGYYRTKTRPSGHDISKGFSKDNGGAIPSNLLKIPNTESNGAYLRGCKAAGLKGHPARFPSRLPEFFIRMLTEPGDLVVDIFCGSNTTGRAAEDLGRRWAGFDSDRGYLATSAFRFLDPKADAAALGAAHDAIASGAAVSIGADGRCVKEERP